MGNIQSTQTAAVVNEEGTVLEIELEKRHRAVSASGESDVLALLQEDGDEAVSQYESSTCSREIDKAVEFVKAADVAGLKTYLDDVQSSGQMYNILSCTDQRGWSLLHLVTDQDSDEIFNLVLQYISGSSKPIVQLLNALTTDEQQLSSLHLAVKNQRVDYVQAIMLQEGIEPDLADSDGCSPLHYACLYGYVNIVKCLAGCDFCLSNNVGDYPLHLAAREHWEEIFTMLEESDAFMCHHSGCDISSLADGKGNTLLHVAVDEKQAKIVNFCLSLGPSVSTINNMGLSPLHVAAMKGNISIAKQLLQKARGCMDERAELVSFINTKSEHHGQTPLYLAAKYDHPDMIDYLLGIDPGVDIECTTVYGFTPLLAAVRYTNLPCVRTLLHKNARTDSQDNKRKLNALLWAVEVEDAQILSEIIQHSEGKKSGDIWKAKDTDGNTPHHLVAKTTNLELLKILTKHNNSCLEQRNKCGSTPFHVAVKEGNLAMVNYIISNSPSSTHSVDGKNNTGLHLAADMGHQPIVKSLLSLHDFGRMVCSQNILGLTPIHLAARAGHDTVLGFLLEHSSPETMEILDKHHSTALYVACQHNRPECVDVLLSHGAMVTYMYGNQGGRKSCLKAAIAKQAKAVVSVILSSSKWEQALQFCEPTVEHRTYDPEEQGSPCSRWKCFQTSTHSVETPLRILIKKMPAAAKLVFDKCIQTKRMPDSYGSYYYERTYNYNYLEDFRDLYPDEGPRHGPERPSVCEDYQADDVYRADYEEKVIADNQIGPVKRRPTLRRKESDQQKLMLSQSSSLPLARPCPLWKPWGPPKYRSRDHPLHLMVYHKRVHLLKHRLVASFIHHKWNLFGKYVYYPNILLYTSLMLLLTVYMHLHFRYSTRLAEVTNVTLSDCSNLVERNATLDFLRSNATIYQPLLRKTHELIVIAVFIIVSCLIRIAIEVVQFVRHLHLYFQSFINYVEVFLYGATIIFVLHFDFDCLPSWRWQLGAVCIFLSWLNFILFLSQQPTFGIYVVMFQHIMKTFLKMVPMTTLLILAFGQPFFMLLSPSTNARDSQTQPFVNFPYSLLKTLTMTIGEFDETDHIFYSNPPILTYEVVTYALWIIFLAVMPILLQNMLVGLAVDDIKGVQEKAVLKKEALQIEFVLDVMSILPKYVIRWLNSREYIQTVGQGRISKFKKWLSGSAWNYKPDEKDDVELKLDSVKQTIEMVDYRLQLLTEQSTKMEKMMIQVSRVTESQHESSQQHYLSVQKSVDFY